MGHELAHTAYMRVRRRKGKRVMKLVSEVLSSSIQLDMLYEKNRALYNLLLRKFKERHVEFQQGKMTAKSNLLGNVTINSLIGNAIAYEMHSRIKDPVERKRIRSALMEKEFSTSEQILNWIKKHSG